MQQRRSSSSWIGLVLGIWMALSSCDGAARLLGDKTITSFSIAGVEGKIALGTISVRMPAGTDLTRLTAVVTFVGAKVEPGSGTAQDFSSPVTYTVTAADGTTHLYTVSVTVARRSDNALTSFVFEARDNAVLGRDIVATISGTTITATVPFGTDVSALVATFVTTGDSVRVGSKLQSTGVTANDFTSAIKYLVIAQDGTLKVYTVLVEIAANTAKALTAFSFDAADNANLPATITGTINGTTITATVPFGTDIRNLVARFATTGTAVLVASIPQVSGVNGNNFAVPVMYTVRAANGTTAVYAVLVFVAPSSAKALGPITFSSTNNPAFEADVTTAQSGTSFTAIVPFGTDLSSLVATFSTTGASVLVAGTPQSSGVTANDFSSVVVYTVVAADGSMQQYTVSLTNSLSGAKDITQFTILGNDGTVSGTQITLTVPFGTDRTALVPTIAITGVSVTPASSVPQNFTTPRSYTVRAADLTTKTYLVTVNVAPSTTKDITRFTVSGLDASIGTTGATTGTISLNVPSGTDRTNLAPIVTHTGASVTPASGVARDFTTPVSYIVTAADGSSRTYLVEIGEVNGNGTKNIRSFSVLGVEGSMSNTTIEVVLPRGTDLSAQTPTIVIDAASVSPPSRAPQNFTMPVLYTVTAADGSTRVYTVTVTTN